MAAPDQQQANPNDQEVAKLFQNVGQGLTLVAQYVQNVAPDGSALAQDLLKGYEQLVQMVVQARQGGQRPAQGQPMPQEAGAAEVRQAY